MATLKYIKFRQAIVFFALLYCLPSSTSYAQQINNQFIISSKSLNVENGLSAPEVFCGVQDSLGFLWFGTRNGLNRFDGKNFQLYNSNNGGLRYNNIAQLTTDNGRRLYIQYGAQGHARLPYGDIDVMDLITGNVQTLSELFPNLPFTEKKVYWVANDGSNNVFFLTFGPFQMWRYNDKTGFKLLVDMKDWNEANEQFSDLTGPNNFFNKGEALLGFRKRSLYTYNNNAVKRYWMKGTGAVTLVKKHQNGSIDFHYINQASGAGRFGSMAADGKINFQPNLNLPFKSLSKEPSPTNNDSTCLFNLPDSGVYYYNGTQLVKIIEAGSMEDFANMQIHANFRDKQNVLWICTSLGIFQVKIKANKFQQYFTKTQQKFETNNQARSIYVDDDGTIYASIWKHLMLQKGQTISAINANEILYAIVKHNNQLFTSSYYLWSLNAAKKQLIQYPKSHSGREIFSALPLNDSIILIGCVEQVYRYNLKQATLTMVTSDQNKFMLPNFVYRFIPNADGTIWTVAESGLYLISKNGHFTEFYGYDNEGKYKFPFKNLTDVFIDKQGIYWLTTNGDGLFRWDKEYHLFNQFAVPQGFPSNVLYRIESDDKNNLWISTENGLVLFNPATLAVNVYTDKDGISHNEFNRMSSFKAKDGRLFFGGINGVNAFDPSDFFNVPTENNIPVRLISFQQFSANKDKLVDKTQQLVKDGKIVLHPGDNFFTIEYRLLDFEDRVHRYAYKIEGQDKDWNYTTDNSIRVSGLPAGKYTLNVKAQTLSGTFSSIQLTFPIEVVAPFYSKPWFQILVLFAVLGCILIFVRIRTATLLKDKLLLEAKVANRTAQLQKTLTERELLLKEIHHRVKNNLQIISGLLDLQKEEIVEEDAKAVFNEGQSRVKSIALIHQNLYQNEDLANIKFSAFVKDLTVQVGEVFEQLNRKMVPAFEIDDFMFDIDTAVPLALILNELLTNSYKYATKADRTGKILIQVKQVTEGNYALVFRDDGPGLKSGITFETAETLGLRLIKGLAAQLYGEASYVYNNGSQFTIYFKDTEARRLE
jgi:two-component sensor histidine kinase/ligand-binding sensor domain-containing protein